MLTYGSISTTDQDFFWVVTAVGFAVLAWASWAWLSALTKQRGDVSRMRPVLRLFALACLLLGIAYLGLINEVVHIYRQGHHYGLRYEAISDFLSILGFCLAALGFWTAAGLVEAGSSLAAESREVEPTIQ